MSLDPDPGRSRAGTADQLAPEDVQRLLATLPVIEQSKGMLMAYYGIDAGTAFKVLRRWSQHSNTKLAEVSAQIVAAGSAASSRPSGALAAYLESLTQTPSPEDRHGLDQRPVGYQEVVGRGDHGADVPQAPAVKQSASGAASRGNADRGRRESAAVQAAREGLASAVAHRQTSTPARS